VDEELLEDIDKQLKKADVVCEATDEIDPYLCLKVARNELQTADKLNQINQQKLTEIILPCDKPLEVDTQNSPFVILDVGVNGVG
ncbi:signal recognition particle-docking protein FtsY, partial [Francisella tularensis subsp. holarctica]|nr:signal recognition particle-docking protein FtsY [Francisella tularensis subsp. holarctica]